MRYSRPTMRDYINQAERLKDYRRMLEDGHGRLKDRDEGLDEP